MLMILILALCLTGCSARNEEKSDGLTVIGSMELTYATQFSVDYCEGGYKLMLMRKEERRIKTHDR